MVSMPRLKAVLVEDNPGIREQLIETLADLAHIEVIKTFDSEPEAKAWTMVNIDQWDIVIVDVFLREGNGLGVVDALQDRPRHKRVVVLTNFATPDIRKRAKSLGADCLFDKSTDLDALIEYCQALEPPTR
jgi:two-component system, OmpR family, response regulator